jgi:hypothetical protein
MLLAVQVTILYFQALLPQAAEVVVAATLMVLLAVQVVAVGLL